jgi:hypothetical protein
MLLPHGRRNRGGTFSGESAYDMFDGGLWSWVVLAQVSIFLIKKVPLPINCPKVKEGTEKRGSIESVVRVIRKTVSTLSAVIFQVAHQPECSSWVMNHPFLSLPNRDDKQKLDGL